MIMMMMINEQSIINNVVADVMLAYQSCCNAGQYYLNICELHHLSSHYIQYINNTYIHLLSPYIISYILIFVLFLCIHVHRLPVPWLLYGIIYGQPVEVNSVGMVCSIAILFMMLLFVVLSIACFRWRMNKGLGFTMFLLYFVFVAVSLMFEYKYLICPV